MRSPYAHSLPPGHGPDRPTAEEREAQPHGYECDRCGGTFRASEGDFVTLADGSGHEWLCAECDAQQARPVHPCGCEVDASGTFRDRCPEADRLYRLFQYAVRRSRWPGMDARDWLRAARDYDVALFRHLAEGRQ